MGWSGPLFLVQTTKTPGPSLVFVPIAVSATGRDFDLPRHYHYSGVIPMVFQHSGAFNTKARGRARGSRAGARRGGRAPGPRRLPPARPAPRRPVLHLLDAGSRFLSFLIETWCFAFSPSSMVSGATQADWLTHRAEGAQCTVTHNARRRTGRQTETRVSLGDSSPRTVALWLSVPRYTRRAVVWPPSPDCMLLLRVVSCTLQGGYGDSKCPVAVGTLTRRPRWARQSARR